MKISALHMRRILRIKNQAFSPAALTKCVCIRVARVVCHGVYLQFEHQRSVMSLKRILDNRMAYTHKVTEEKEEKS